MESEPMVSFVTPFYNTEKYLAECIESVLRQTYQNWEYVLVDNQSTDGSGEIAEKYASRFPGKLRLFRTSSFLSQVENYNFALSCIAPTGTYCKVVQADDWLFPDCARSMVEIAEAHPTVGIVGAYELEGSEVSLDCLPYPSTKVEGRNACRLYFLTGKYLFGTPTSLLLRSELVRSRQPFYNERYAPFEDAHICFDLLRSWDFGFVHQVLSFSRRDNESIHSRIRYFGLVSILYLSMLAAHGRNYLTAEEYARCLNVAERQYFLFLGHSVCALHRPTPAFWEFQRRVLASVNYSLRWRLLWKWLPRAFLEKTWGTFWPKWDAFWDGDDRLPDL